MTDPHLGRTLDGRYVVHRLLGKGGMGAVYEARHTVLDRRVAVKFLLEAASAADLERFRREARTAGRIAHANVAQIFDAGADGDTAYIVMELVDGTDLRRLLASEGPLAPARAVELTRQILAGLHAIHDAGIVHRDIKPANVVLTHDGIVKIMDFGISKTREPGLTRTGSVIGTPEYMAPEQHTGRSVDHRADLYAVGVTLHVMLTGELPGETRRALPPDLAPVIERALARSPADRFASAREFAAALANPAHAETALADTSPTASAPTVPATPRAKHGPSRWPIIVLSTALAATGAALAWQMTRDRPVATAAAPDAAAATIGAAPSAAPVAAPDAATAVAAEVVRDAAPDGAPDVLVDAAVATTPVDAKPRPAKPRGLRCMCVDGVSLCPSKAKAPLCQCRDARGVGRTGAGGRILCPEPAPGGKCPVEGYDKRVAGKQPGEPCEGYFSERHMAGVYNCTWCLGVELRAFRGKQFDRCTAFDRHTGERRKGVLDACTDDPDLEVLDP